MSKNMADYTNFQEGKTNKKIIHPPGGASSFSIGWSNEKTDYGPEKTSKKRYQNEEQINKANTIKNFTKDSRDNTNQYNPKYLDSKTQTNYINNRQLPPKPQQQIFNQRTCIKIEDKKSTIVIGDNNYNYWEEIKKQTFENKPNSRQSVKKPNSYEQPLIRKVLQQKTTVKVNNPPGGKSSFIFG